MENSVAEHIRQSPSVLKASPKEWLNLMKEENKKPRIAALAKILNENYKMMIT